ncbi:MAG: PadR family transcriptional regulator [Promethearchaeota archaeon]
MKIFPRKALGLIILSILDEHPEGLTGYAITSEIKERFKPIREVSPGTIYPRLEKLKNKGIIIEEGKIYKISSKGKERLTEKIPEVIRKSLKFMPMLYKSLMRPLPFGHRMNFLSNMGSFFYNLDDSTHKNFFGDLMFPEDLQSKNGLTKSITKLQTIKKRLLHLKTKIKEIRDTELRAIDGKINLIDDKIIKYQNEKEDWKGVKIKDEDSGEG